MRVTYLFCLGIVLLLSGCLERQLSHDEILALWDMRGDQLDGSAPQQDSDATTAPDQLQAETTPPLDLQSDGPTASDQSASDNATPDTISPDAVGDTAIADALAPDGSGADAGDVSDADPTAPTATIGSKPAALTSQTSASFSFTCDLPPCGFQCKLDSGSYQACNTGEKSYNSLLDGPHTFYVEATKGLKQQGVPTSYSWTIDSIPPTTKLQTTPPAVTDQKQLTFDFSCVDASSCSFKCQLDGGPWFDCNSPYTTPELDFADHTFKVYAIDAAGLPSQVAPSASWRLIGWTQVSAGGSYCAIATDDSLWCWGGNGYGELGLGDKEPRERPVRVESSSWKSVQSNFNSTCAINGSSELLCSGVLLPRAQETDPTTSTLLISIAGSTKWKWFDGRFGTHHCGIKSDNSLWCGGTNGNGQLGRGSTESGPFPLAQVKSGSQFKLVSTGLLHTCAIDSADKLWCWGGNSSGQVGNNSVSEKESTPLQIASSSSWKSVTAGVLTTCAITTANQLYCWGVNIAGALGLNLADENAVVTTPQLMDSTKTWIYVRAGSFALLAGPNFCASTASGANYCWGANGNNQLGSSTEKIFVPMEITNTPGLLGISNGEFGSCAIATDQSLWCSGLMGNTQDELKFDTFTNLLLP